MLSRGCFDGLGVLGINHLAKDSQVRVGRLQRLKLFQIRPEAAS